MYVDGGLPFYIEHRIHSVVFLSLQACNDYLKTADSQGHKWSKMLQHERDQRQHLEEMVEQLARQHSHLEEAAHRHRPSKLTLNLVFLSLDRSGVVCAVMIPIEYSCRCATKVSHFHIDCMPTGHPIHFHRFSLRLANSFKINTSIKRLPSPFICRRLSHTNRYPNVFYNFRYHEFNHIRRRRKRVFRCATNTRHQWKYI